MKRSQREITEREKAAIRFALGLWKLLLKLERSSRKRETQKKKAKSLRKPRKIRKQH